MEHVYRNPADDARLILSAGIDPFERYFNERFPDGKLFTIVWNTGAEQVVTIDEIVYPFPANTILPIMMDQSFRFSAPATLVSWQFNREFYCLANHDAEVGCVGFVFYGPSPTMFVTLDDHHTGVIQRHLAVFDEEFSTEEEIKEEMLRTLLVRLIIQVTRLARKQYLGPEIPEEKFNLIRQYNLLVEIHYRKQHQVQFYAGLLNRSPKTISNFFSQFSNKTPLQFIQDRIITEAKRFLYYTDKSIKEIASDLGFDDAAHFSKFFRNYTGANASAFKKVK